MKYLLLVLLWTATIAPALAQYDLYANDGTYLGNTSTNQFDPNSVNNPYGKYGSQYSPDSINNQFGQYGSQFSPSSPNNQFATPGKAVPSYGSYGQPYGGYSNQRY